MSVNALSEKAAHLLAAVDRQRPELAAVTTAEGLLACLAASPRPRFRFEYARKAQMLAFLHEHYTAWRAYDTTEADRLVGLTIAQAQGPRALATVIELGKAWWATSDPRYGAAFQRFYLETPTGEMFNWDEFNGTQGAIELDAFFLLQDCDGFTVDGRIAFLDHLYAITENAWDVHTSHWNQIMLGPEGHNWYLHGMHALPLLGLLFPEFMRADFLLRSGWSMVEDHVRGHLQTDGGARETAIGYQIGSMLNLWDFYLIAHRNGYPMSAGFADRLLNSTKFLLKLMSPAGGIPSYGDGGHAPGQLTELAAVATALTGDRECKWYAEYCRAHRRGMPAETPGEIPECAFWATGLEGAATYAQTRARCPHQRSVLFGTTGYAALRDSDQPDAHYLAIAAADRGPIVTSHGHNDIFSLDVHAGGVRFIGEMGCAPYGNSPGRWYDQLTEAHTCLTIAGQEQVPIVNEWRWSARVSPVVRRWVSEETHDFFHGLHEGFYQYPDALRLHARKIFFLKASPAYWVVLDWVESNIENDYLAYFHGCVPGTLDGTTILLDGGDMRLAVIPPAGDAVTASRITSDGLTAFVQEKSLSAEQYPCFAYAQRAASTCFAWVLMPCPAGEALPTVKRLPVSVNNVVEDAYGATAVEIAFPGYTDTLCVSHKDYDAQLIFGAHQQWGSLAFRRVNAAGATVLSIAQTMADGVCGR